VQDVSATDRITGYHGDNWFRDDAKQALKVEDVQVIFLPGERHGQRSLAGHSPWGCKRVGPS